MAGEPSEPTLAALETFLDHIVALLDAVTKLVTEQDGRIEELEAAVAGLGVRLETLHLLRVNRERELEQRITSVDERVSTVHRHALRSLNLRTGGDTPG